MEIFKPKLFNLIERKAIQRSQLSAEVLSGIVVGIVALPLAIAFAVASGVSPEKGIITAVIAGFLISFLGGSRVQIGGPTGAFVVIVYSIIEKYGLDGLLISTVLAGFILVCFGLLRLGTLLKFIPLPLIVGFTSGIALVIFSIQIKDALGLTSNVPSAFISKWVYYFKNLNLASISSIIVCASTILITVYSKRLTSKIPGSFFAIIFVSLAVYFLKTDVATIGSVFGTLPSNIDFSLPNINIENLTFYLAPALTIALLGGIESLLSAVVADGMIVVPIIQILN